MEKLLVCVTLNTGLRRGTSGINLQLHLAQEPRTKDWLPCTSLDQNMRRQSQQTGVNNRECLGRGQYLRASGKPGCLLDNVSFPTGRNGGNMPTFPSSTSPIFILAIANRCLAFTSSRYHPGRTSPSLSLCVPPPPAPRPVLPTSSIKSNSLSSSQASQNLSAARPCNNLHPLLIASIARPCCPRVLYKSVKHKTSICAKGLMMDNEA